MIIPDGNCIYNSNMCSCEKLYLVLNKDNSQVIQYSIYVDEYVLVGYVNTNTTWIHLIDDFRSTHIAQTTFIPILSDDEPPAIVAKLLKLAAFQ